MFCLLLYWVHCSSTWAFIWVLMRKQNGYCIAKWIDMTHLMPAEKVFIWGHYYLSKVLNNIGWKTFCSSKVFNMMQHEWRSYVEELAVLCDKRSSLGCCSDFGRTSSIVWLNRVVVVVGGVTWLWQFWFRPHSVTESLGTWWTTTSTHPFIPNTFIQINLCVCCWRYMHLDHVYDFTSKQFVCLICFPEAMEYVKWSQVSSGMLTQ